MGEVLSHKKGIQQWAKKETKSSERDVHRVVKKQRTTLPLEISELNIQGDSLPWISPRAWLEFIIQHGLLYMLSGLKFETRSFVGNVWRTFWQNYTTLVPDCGVTFLDGINYERLIALYIHGDEGRTLKRGGLMVTSIQSVLGHGFDQKRLKRPAGINDRGKLQVNFTGHTFVTRLVCGVLPKTEYQNNPSFFHENMDLFADQLQDLLHTGVRDPVTGVVWKFAVIGIKGDMPYLQKVGCLKRSWNTSIKRGTQRTAPKGVCHLCLAGTTNFPAEDTSDNPCWLRTIAVREPWDRMPKIIRLLPFARGHPGAFLKPDLWHCIHLGIGKSFVASAVQISLEMVPASNNDERFQWLTDHYKRWCKKVGRSTYVGKITAYLVSYGDGPGATANWSKGSLTSNLCRWLVKLLEDLGPDENNLLPRCKLAAKDINTALSFLYNAPLFLDKAETMFVCKKGMDFVQAYTSMATECFHNGDSHLFPLFPKQHAVHHCWHTMSEDCRLHGFSMNPLTASCQLDEDVIGRVSRTSRRVSIRLVGRRTLQRHLMASWDVWHKAGLLRWKKHRLFPGFGELEGGSLKYINVFDVQSCSTID